MYHQKSSGINNLTNITNNLIEELLCIFSSIKNNIFFLNKVLRLIYFLRSMNVMFNLTAHYKIVLYLNKDNSNAYGSRS